MSSSYDEDTFYDYAMDADLVRQARNLLTDYYGTAMYGGFPGAGGDFDAVRRMSDAQVVEEAVRLGLLR